MDYDRSVVTACLTYCPVLRDCDFLLRGPMKKWYELIGSNGESLASPSKVVVAASADVDDLKYLLSSLTYSNLWLFRKAVWKENPNKLKYVDTCDLDVYKCK